MKTAAKNKKHLLLDVAIVLVTVVAVGYGIAQWGAEDTSFVCKTAGKRHELTIRDNAFNKQALTVERCDTLVIGNLDDEPYQLAFGTKDRHIEYLGYESQLLGTGESIAIDTVETGNFELHDHLRDQARLQLTVKPLTD